MQYLSLTSMKESEKIRANQIKDFQNFCNEVGKKAQEKGLTEEKLLQLLKGL